MAAGLPRPAGPGPLGVYSQPDLAAALDVIGKLHMPPHRLGEPAAIGRLVVRRARRAAEGPGPRRAAQGRSSSFCCGRSTFRSGALRKEALTAGLAPVPPGGTEPRRAATRSDGRSMMPSQTPGLGSRSGTYGQPGTATDHPVSAIRSGRRVTDDLATHAGYRSAVDVHRPVGIALQR